MDLDFRFLFSVSLKSLSRHIVIEHICTPYAHQSAQDFTSDIITSRYIWNVLSYIINSIPVSSVHLYYNLLVIYIRILPFTGIFCGFILLHPNVRTSKPGSEVLGHVCWTETPQGGVASKDMNNLYALVSLDLVDIEDMI